MIKHIFTLVWNKRKSNLLFFAEIFFSFLILFVVFTFVIYNLRQYNTPLGFDTEDIILAGLSFPEEMDSLAVIDTKEQLQRELEALPQIISTSFTESITPFSGSSWTNSNDSNGFPISTAMCMVDENYAETAGLNLIAGRWFEKDDLNAKYPPVVITKKLKDEFLGDKEILDSLLILLDPTEHRVIGIVENFKYFGEFSDEKELSFFLNAPHDRDASTIHMRLQPNTPASIEEDINRTIAQITKNNEFITWNLENARKQTSRATWIPIIALLSICGFLIFNVALGLFGVLWFNISKRRPEIGLRRALGAAQSEISQQFVGEVFMVVLLGMLLGLFFAIQFPILKVIPIPPSNFYYAMLAAAGLISVLVLLCAYYPSRQASKVQPAIALHEN